jgi:phage gpG-like protein
MTPEELRQRLESKIGEIQHYAGRVLPQAIAAEAVDSFKENFETESFDGKAWPDVKRRDPNSPWYGFEYGNTGTYTPPHTGTGRPQSRQRKNFNQDRTIAKILHGQNKELKDAIRALEPIEPGHIVISNEKPYAAVHNYGEQAKVFGKHPFTMPQRQFMGVTDELKNRIRDKIKRDLTRIINS